MKRIALTALLLSWSSFFLFAQNEQDRNYIINQTNVEKLEELSKRAQAAYAAARRDPSIPKEIIYKDGRVAELTGIDRNGKAIYSCDDNEAAAISSKVNRIQEGGASGFDLDGKGIEIGVWESDIALKNHQEIIGRVTHAEADNEGGHATHTGTTLIGEGVNSKARGMAPAATILSYSSSGDEPEIIDFAVKGGILSNHSYSSENPDGNTPEYGVYTPYTEEWDELLFNAPYLTQVNSASNSRDDGVNTGDGGYDIIFGSNGAKNNITVGAVYDVLDYNGPSSVSQSEFSNWGPTDDWRIKPDITANGVTLWSGNNGGNQDYSTRSGTSMSTPVVTGSIALLQQYYHDLFGVYMKAATVKSLLICTTDEVGFHDGPDFQSGWGLLNAERAAEVIANNGSISNISELSINNGETYIKEIEVDGNSSLELVISWSDPAATPLSGAAIDDPTPMLVNDLDVRITGNDTLYFPWVLSPNSVFTNFNDAAQKGDNFRDNSERIDISSLEAGLYTVTVSHKGNLENGDQDFSMVINGLKTFQVGVSDQVRQEASFLVYPVPNPEQHIQIAIPEQFYSPTYTLQIFSIDGRLQTSATYNDQKLSLDVSHLNNGTYFIRIQTEKGQRTEKIIIER